MRTSNYGQEVPTGVNIATTTLCTEYTRSNYKGRRHRCSPTPSQRGLLNCPFLTGKSSFGFVPTSTLHQLSFPCRLHPGVFLRRGRAGVGEVRLLLVFLDGCGNVVPQESTMSRIPTAFGRMKAGKMGLWGIRVRLAGLICLEDFVGLCISRGVDRTRYVH